MRRIASLEDLSAEFQAALPEFAQATDELTNKLFELQTATDVIKTMAGAQGVIARIVTLLG